MTSPPEPASGVHLIDGLPIVLRPAVAADLPAIVALLADDPLGVRRETSGDDLEPYESAFAVIDADPAHLLVVACDGPEVVGTLQLSLVPGLSRAGMLRGQIEAVRVRGDRQSTGLGGALITWAIEESRRRGAGLVQLTTDKQRRDAHRFYERWGFVASHEGYKLSL